MKHPPSSPVHHATRLHSLVSLQACQIMHSNCRQSAAPKARTQSITPAGDCKIPRKVLYKVGYNWNKGGRLKELRIRHLARKFLSIWIRNCFGRILPHAARSHYNLVVLRKTFEGWKEEWWTSRREWSLTLRAMCHYRYHLCYLTIRHWRMFMSLQRDERSKVQRAQSLADKKRMCRVWAGWLVFMELKKVKNRNGESALAQKRLAVVRSAWSLWQSRLGKRRCVRVLEVWAVKNWTLHLKRRAWLRWKETHAAARSQRKEESKAWLGFIIRRKRTSWCRWRSYVSCRRTKKKSGAAAERARRLHLMAACWRLWSGALRRRRCEAGRLQAAGHLAVGNRQRRALRHWKTYVALRREASDRRLAAGRHRSLHLQRLGLRGLRLNLLRNKVHRLNADAADRHFHRSMLERHWKLWQERLEEAEDLGFQQLTGVLLTDHGTFLLRRYFHIWRKKGREQRDDQESERRADRCFARRLVPRHLRAWGALALRRKLRRERRIRADAYDRRRRCNRAFYAWWRRAERNKEAGASQQKAVLHHDQRRVLRAWTRWRRGMELLMEEQEKRRAADRLHVHTLLRKAVTQWRDAASRLTDRRTREELARRHGDRRRTRWAMEKWKKFVQSRRVKGTRLEQMRRHHEASLTRRAFAAWKEHHLQKRHLSNHADDLYRQRARHLLGEVLSTWKKNSALLAEARLREQQAQRHHQHRLQLQVLTAWRAETTLAQLGRVGKDGGNPTVSERHQLLLWAFRLWRARSGAARDERRNQDRARRHHMLKLLSKALVARGGNHGDPFGHEVTEKQADLLLRLKTYRTFFDEWTLKLRRRRRASEQSVRALWHWAFALQAKVFLAWRRWVTERRSAAREVEADATESLTFRGPGSERVPEELVAPEPTLRSMLSFRSPRRLPRRPDEAPPPGSSRYQAFPPRSGPNPGWKPPPASSASTAASLETLRRGTAAHVTCAPRLSGLHPAWLQEVRRSPRPAVVPMALPSGLDPNPRRASQNQDLLLPPAAFMINRSRDGGVGDTGPDPYSTLMTEVRRIRDDMVQFHEDRKQLKTWRMIQEVYEGWLRINTDQDGPEKTSVYQNLKELEQKIRSLAADLESRRPGVLQQEQRITNLKAALQAHHPAAAKSPGPGLYPVNPVWKDVWVPAAPPEPPPPLHRT